MFLWLFSIFFLFPPSLPFYSFLSTFPPISTARCSEMKTSALKTSPSSPTMSDDIKMAFQAQPLNCDHNLPDELHASVDQIVDTKKQRQDIDSAYCCALAAPFRNFNYNYAHSMKWVYFSSTVNPDATKYATAVHNFDGMKLRKALKRHRFRTVKTLMYYSITLRKNINQ